MKFTFIYPSSCTQEVNTSLLIERNLRTCTARVYRSVNKLCVYSWCPRCLQYFTDISFVTLYPMPLLTVIVKIKLLMTSNLKKIKSKSISFDSILLFTKYTSLCTSIHCASRIFCEKPHRLRLLCSLTIKKYSQQFVQFCCKANLPTKIRVDKV